MTQGVHEFPGEFYTSKTKETVTVVVDVNDLMLSFQSRHVDGLLNQLNCEFTLVKRGWVFTDFQLRRVRTGEVYKLTFWNAAGDKVRQFLEWEAEVRSGAREI